LHSQLTVTETHLLLHIRHLTSNAPHSVPENITLHFMSHHNISWRR